MLKQILICLGSGVLYAAFLQSGVNLHPFILLLSIFLPTLLFVPAMILGVFGVLLSVIPILFVLESSEKASILQFLILSMSPALLVGYIFYDRFRFLQKEGRVFGEQRAVEVAAYGQILLFSLFLAIPQTHVLVDTFIDKLAQAIKQVSNINRDISLSQISILMPMVYIFINLYCIKIASTILKKIQPGFVFPEKNYDYSPWIDIPVLFFLLIQTLADIIPLSPSIQFIVSWFLMISLWPVLFLGIQVFKVIGTYYGFSKKIVNGVLFVLFFLVHPLVFIVLLGFMESSSSISQRFHRKHF